MRSALARAVGAEPARMVVAHQVHGRGVARVHASSAGETVSATDALVTDVPGLPLFVQGADCPLVALVDPDAGVAAAIHSGWRGTVLRIVQVAIEVAAAAGARPERLRVAVFPGIGPCCYQVGPDVRAAFEDAFAGAAAAWFGPDPDDAARFRLDVRSAIVATARSAGVPAAAIDVVPGCTACGGRLWSHRASGGGPERHGLAVALTAAGPA